MSDSIGSALVTGLFSIGSVLVGAAAKSVFDNQVRFPTRGRLRAMTGTTWEGTTIQDSDAGEQPVKDSFITAKFSAAGRTLHGTAETRAVIQGQEYRSALRLRGGFFADSFLRMSYEAFIAVIHGTPLLTANLRFSRLEPGLPAEAWLVP
jgi:hypothetical protein